MFLHSHGVGTARAVRIFKIYGADAVEVMTENPYRLARDTFAASGFGDLDTLVPAYAATVHKSQGSEYPAVVIPVLTQYYAMLRRNLLYTGVTRDKRLMLLVGQKKAVAIPVGVQRRPGFRLAEHPHISSGLVAEWRRLLPSTGKSGPERRFWHRTPVRQSVI